MLNGQGAAAQVLMKKRRDMCPTPGFSVWILDPHRPEAISVTPSTPYYQVLILALRHGQLSCYTRLIASPTWGHHPLALLFREA